MNNSNSRRKQVYGTGLIALDLVISANPDMPVRSWAGGTCGNVLSILSYLGWDAYPIARLNGDPASKRIRADMKRWGVHLDFVGCGPTTDTPIIVQQVLRAHDGSPRHRFTWSCPHCGNWLPSFKPVTTKAVQRVLGSLSNANVFFMDRLSPAALLMAQQAAANGAVVMFEPSARSDEKLLRKAVEIAHIVKYSNHRFARIVGAMEQGSATLVEVQTLGEHGLRYRHRFGSSVSGWRQLDAVAASKLTDTCGSGDWCTAGLLSIVATGGREGLIRAGAAGLATALRYGQTLAAWNCGFEGARGGMYMVERRQLNARLQALSSGQIESEASPTRTRRSSHAVVVCPACRRDRARRKVPRAARLRQKSRHRLMA